MSFLLRFDGGANPNPGPCAGAFVLYNHSGEIVSEGAQFVGAGTNNIGEYTGLLIGLRKCVEMGVVESLRVEGDSLLVICQMIEKWQVKNQKLMELKEEASDWARQLKSVTFHHIRREFNAHADSLCDRALATQSSF